MEFDNLGASGLDRRHFLGAGMAALGGCASVRRPLGMGRKVDLIDDLQERTFRYFWDTTDPLTGLAPDRWPTPSFASIAAVGFALTAYPIGVAHGWIDRAQARSRTLTTLEFFAAAPQGEAPSGMSGYRGFFYHFLGTTKGQRFAKSELSTIDTALLLGGVLFAQAWFDEDHPDEVRIRELADKLYFAVEWDWITPRQRYLAMGWHPESGFIADDWNIYNESMILYVLALGSPTHPIPAERWDMWTETFEKAWQGEGNQAYAHFPPLFGHQYSHVWIDFRGIRDRFIGSKKIDYFENSIRATRAQRAYAIANPGGWKGYDADVWGLTACDGPGDFSQDIAGRKRDFFSYSARGPGDRDDGTIAPTAAAGSIAFTPDICVPAIEAMHRRYGPDIYGKYGFLDSFNPTLSEGTPPLKHGQILPGTGWVDNDYVGIDQGPIVAGIENLHSGMIWKAMRRNPHIRRGLERAGFRGGWLDRG